MRIAKSNYHLIKDAYNSLNKKKFNNAIIILEKVLSSGVGDIYVLFLLAVAYLYTDQFGKAARFITKMKDMNQRYLPLLQLEAFLRLKSSMSRDEIVKNYLDLYAKYPADPYIHHGKDLVMNSEDFTKLQRDARLYDFVHIFRPPRSLKKMAKSNVYTGRLERNKIFIIKDFPFLSVLLKGTLLAVVLAVVLFVGIYVFQSGLMDRVLTNDRRTKNDLSGVDRIRISGTEYDIVKNMSRGEVRHYYDSVSEMTDDFNHARRLIKAEKYNDAMLILNKIYNSNINYVVKEKVEFLIKFVIDLDERFYERRPIKEVLAKKYLYRGCCIEWEGRAMSVKEKGGTVSFILEVNYRGEKDCDGKADIFSEKPVRGLKEGGFVSVKGMIMNIIGPDERLYVVSQGIALLR